MFPGSTTGLPQSVPQPLGPRLEALTALDQVERFSKNSDCGSS
jgi:hypothetical protein